MPRQEEEADLEVFLEEIVVQEQVRANVLYLLVLVWMQVNVLYPLVLVLVNVLDPLIGEPLIGAR